MLMKKFKPELKLQSYDLFRIILNKKQLNPGPETGSFDQRLTKTRQKAFLRDTQYTNSPCSERMHT